MLYLSFEFLPDYTLETFYAPFYLFVLKILIAGCNTNHPGTLIISRSPNLHTEGEKTLVFHTHLS